MKQVGTPMYTAYTQTKRPYRAIFLRCLLGWLARQLIDGYPIQVMEIFDDDGKLIL